MVEFFTERLLIHYPLLKRGDTLLYICVKGNFKEKTQPHEETGLYQPNYPPYCLFPGQNGFLSIYPRNYEIVREGLLGHFPGPATRRASVNS